MSIQTQSVDLVGEEAVGNVTRAALFAALTGAFAYVSFPNPLSPAPITLQVLGIFLAGLFLGPIWGGLSMVLYLVAGGVGAPIFSGGAGGVGVLFGPTAGYLWAAPFAAFVTGYVVHGGLELRNPAEATVVRLAGGMVLATAVIYLFGVVGLALVLALGLPEAFAAGALAFLPAEAIKIAAAVGIVRSEAIRAK